MNGCVCVCVCVCVSVCMSVCLRVCVHICCRVDQIQVYKIEHFHSNGASPVSVLFDPQLNCSMSEFDFFCEYLAKGGRYSKRYDCHQKARDIANVTIVIKRREI